MKPKTVNKMLSPEENAVIDNISALIQELKNIGAAEQNIEAKQNPMENNPEKTQMMSKQEEQTDRPPENEEEINKAIEDTPSEGSTADTPAGERDVENLPDLTEDNAMMLAKILTAMAGKSAPVKKSVTKKDSTTEVLKELVTVVKSMNQRQSEVENAVESILSGLGVAKAMEEQNTQKVEKSKQIHGTEELEKLIQYVAKGLKTEEEKDDTYMSTNQNEMARKSISSWLPSLVKGGK